MAKSKRDERAMKAWASAQRDGTVVDLSGKVAKPVTKAGLAAGWAKDGPSMSTNGVQAYAATRNAELASGEAKDKPSKAAHEKAASLHTEAAKAHEARGDQGASDVSYHEDKAAEHSAAGDKDKRDEKGRFTGV